jgi:alpha-glucuronidase
MPPQITNRTTVELITYQWYNAIVTQSTVVMRCGVPQRVHSTWSARVSVLAILVVAIAATAHAETGYQAWLRYAPLPAPIMARIGSVPTSVTLVDDSPVLRSARDEVVRGLSSILATPITSSTTLPSAPTILLGTLDRIRRLVPAAPMPADLTPDGFWLGTTTLRGHTVCVVAGPNERGVLYGAFALLQRIARGENVSRLNERQEPAAPIRWVNHWDNLDGTIERGYAGRSIFFESGRVLDDLTRVRDYGRLLASVGINGVTVNNVNANPLVITDAFIPQIARIADVLRPWGVAVSVSVDFSSPRRIGGLDTFDPLDARVAAFWKDRVDALYRSIPDLGGIVLKADSEGRLGPSAYNRTHADAANVIARALAPHKGVIFYRGFVYDNLMDWRNPKNDRARAAYDNFHPLDGTFDANVVLQIKHGPIDFQVREPASPLFGALRNTNQAIELQITQEYLGQQRHVCFLVPMWKTVLDFDMLATSTSPGTPVRELVSGRTFNRPVGGFIGVSNVGRDTNWLGHDLAMANLYGFGRLGWNPTTSARSIAADWAIQTFGHDPQVVETVTSILLDSWPAYERYTGPLGAGTLTDIIRVHYGPGIESSERNGWGQWHRANGQGIGMDRTVATGTGFSAQYVPLVGAQFESLASTPDELLLFFHHVPYTHVLHSGKTVIQHIYDSHYEGAEQAADFVTRWRTLERLIDRERYTSVLAKLEYQAGHAIVWRDAINNWFLWISGIADTKGRAGRFPGRVEAEAMIRERYVNTAVVPWETASAGQATTCEAGQTCIARHRYEGPAGTFDIAVQYFDEDDGASRFSLLVGDRQIDSWIADGHFGSATPNGHTATRRTAPQIRLAPGDELRVQVVPDAMESGALDYIEITSSP